MDTETKDNAAKDSRTQKQPSFAPPPEIPTQEAVDGILFDFNCGLRVSFPKDGGQHRLLFRDLDSGIVLYCMDAEPGSTVVSVKRYFVRFGIEIYRKDDLDHPAFTHELNLEDRDVLIQIPQGALGDAIAWFSYVERFAFIHKCRVHVSMADEIADIFRGEYPGISFVTQEKAAELRPYATYNLGLFFGGDTDSQPFDFRQAGLHRTAGHILGLNNLHDQPPRVNTRHERIIREPYAVIATQASSQCKYWNNPSGWREVISWLKSQGLRVICIDRFPEYGSGIVFNRIPWGCEDWTGDRPLQERIDVIKDAEVFIGLSSGLSWLAWCCNVPVVMISGFTDPVNEFLTPWRVQNIRVCHGCWNDMRCEFDHGDFLWCPRKGKTDDKFECTKAITAKMVIEKAAMALERRMKDGGNNCEPDGKQALDNAGR